jgi:hypothetical protein
MGPAKKEVTVSDQWQRIVWTAKPGVSSWGYTIRFTIPKGTLWIAAPMWVLGAEAAPFALNPADVPAIAPARQAQPQKPVPSVVLPYVAEIGLDADHVRDAIAGRAVQLSPFVDLYNGNPAKTQTRVRLVATDLGLHIAFDCLQPDMANVQISGEKKDGSVYGGECVEFFIAPERTSGPYYHFAVNPNGVQADEEGFDPSWDGNWVAHTRKYSDHWTAEIDLGWAGLPIGAKAGTVWAMNFCRHAKATTEELSEWSCTEGSFHNPSRFGLVTVPESIVAARAMDLAWGGTWTQGDQWGLTLAITPGAQNSGRRTVRGFITPPANSPAPAAGGWHAATEAVFIPSRPVTVKLGPVPGKPVPGEYTAWVTTAAGSGAVDTSRRLRHTVLQSAAAPATGAALSALLDRSYYTTEAQARLRVWCRDPRAAEVRVEVGARVYRGKLAPGSGARRAEVVIPLAPLALGETPVRVSVADRSGTALDLTASDKIVKLADQPYGVKVDRFAACFIVDGKPFVPYCMGIHSLNQVDRLQDIKDHGFNTICAGFGGSATEQDLQANLPTFNRFFDACRKLGLKIIWWNGGGESYEKIRDGFLRNITAFRDNDLLLAWYILDEPEGWWESPTRKESDLAQFHEAVAHADPYRPSFFNYYAWRKGTGGYGGLVASDVGSLDRYPIGRGDAMKTMDDITRTMASDCLPAGKPVNIWLQLYGYDDAVREATPAEQRCQTYLCLIEGARSVMYFIYKPMGRAMWESMQPLGAEIEALTPVFAAAPPEREITVNSDAIRFMLRVVGGKWYIVCANRSTSTVTAAFDVSSLLVEGFANEKWTNRQLKISGGKLTDTFPPLATRVYVIPVPGWEVARPGR